MFSGVPMAQNLAVGASIGVIILFVGRFLTRRGKKQKPIPASWDLPHMQIGSVVSVCYGTGILCLVLILLPCMAAVKSSSEAPVIALFLVLVVGLAVLYGVRKKDLFWQQRNQRPGSHL